MRAAKNTVLGLLILTHALVSAPTSSARTPSRCFNQEPTIIGTRGDDRIVGTGGDDVIVGLAGDDVIDGSGGADLVCAGLGNDRVGLRTDYGLFGAVNGGRGDDRIFARVSEGRALLGGKGNDHITGGRGLLDGGPGADVVTGWQGAAYISGGAGNDNLRGRPKDVAFYDRSPNPIHLRQADRTVTGWGRDLVTEFISFWKSVV